MEWRAGEVAVGLWEVWTGKPQKVVKLHRIFHRRFTWSRQCQIVSSGNWMALSFLLLPLPPRPSFIATVDRPRPRHGPHPSGCSTSSMEEIGGQSTKRWLAGWLTQFTPTQPEPRSCPLPRLAPLNDRPLPDLALLKLPFLAGGVATSSPLPRGVARILSAEGKPRVA